MNMAVSFSTFDRLKGKGVAAYKSGDYLAAKTYLVDAAECLLEMAETTKSTEAKRQHEEIAAELIDLAKDCDRLHSGGRRAKPVERGGKGGAQRRREQDDDSGADASDWIVRDKPTIGFDDIAGLEDVKAEIRLKMIYPFSHRELAKQYGISTGGGLLLYGPPGTGKTMIAKAIAHEIDATMFVISPAQVLSKWVGEAEQNIRKLFSAAKEEDSAIIFIDEIEALVPSRRSSQSSVMNRVVPQILQELEGFDRSSSSKPLLFVGATNEPWALDSAVMRPGRFDSKVHVPLPDEPARFRLLEIYCGKRPLADDVDFGVLVKRLVAYSGADIRAIAQKAAAVPFMEAIGGSEPRPVTMADLLAVIDDFPPSVRKKDLLRFEEFAAVN
ncbi:MAG: ATP-binding protein [Planctomycetes bacterium]|nr:ATP-binding protein [Planctomycetota bacterium]